MKKEFNRAQTDDIVLRYFGPLAKYKTPLTAAKGSEMKEEIGVLGLSTIRKNRGISLEQISASTKIGVRSLEAIERGDFSKLPGGIYNTSYIRQYARAIDYPESTILAFYDRTMASLDASSTRSSGGGNGIYGGFRPASTTAGS